MLSLKPLQAAENWGGKSNDTTPSLSLGSELAARSSSMEPSGSKVFAELNPKSSLQSPWDAGAPAAVEQSNASFGSEVPVDLCGSQEKAVPAGAAPLLQWQPVPHAGCMVQAGASEMPPCGHTHAVRAPASCARSGQSR